MATRGFSMDSSSRLDVVEFYHSIYQASEGYRHRVGWTGHYNSTAAGAEGTVSAEFVGDVERRVNYYRALCGLPAEVRMNSSATVRVEDNDRHDAKPSTVKAAAAQRSALMIVRTYPGSDAMSHDPATSCVAWTPEAWNANKNGNLALGLFGPGAVDAYISENVTGLSDWNVNVGHRRWLLFQRATDMATGDTPGHFSGSTIRPPTNTMYVVPKLEELNASHRSRFHAFPPAGFMPARHNSNYWSLSHPLADFSAATVTVRDAAMANVPVAVVSRSIGLGDASLVWQVPSSVAATTTQADRTFHVSVAGVKLGSNTVDHEYTVTLINPDRLDFSPTLQGDATPMPSGASYAVADTGGAAIEAAGFLREASTWREGAEDGTDASVIPSVSGTYNFRTAAAGWAKSGSRSFHLTFPTRYDPVLNGVPEQSFEIDREILPAAGGQLRFHYRRGLMTQTSRMAVEASTDQGLTWSKLAEIAGNGGTTDGAFHASTVALPSTGAPVRVRFRLHLSTPTSPLYAYEDYPAHHTGICIDDIETIGCDWLRPGKVAALADGGPFLFDSLGSGLGFASGQTWWLRARARVGGKAFAWGAPTIVRPHGPLQLVGPADPPVSGANYTFVPDPAAGSYTFEVAEPADGSWAEGAEDTTGYAAAVSGTYDVRSTRAGYRKSGTASYRLALSSATDTDEILEFTRKAIPGAASTLSFWTRRGSISATNQLSVEVSADGGTGWTQVWTLNGAAAADGAMALRTVSLAAWAGQDIRLRLALRTLPGGKNNKWNAGTSGVWIDDLEVTSPATERWAKETTIAAGLIPQVRLNAASAGRSLAIGTRLRLRMKSVTGGNAGPWGPSLEVVTKANPVPGFERWHTASHYPLPLDFAGDSNRDGVPDGIEYAFSITPEGGGGVSDEVTVDADLLILSRLLPETRDDVEYGAEWSADLAEWSTEGVTVWNAGGRLHASVPREGPVRMLRWKVSRKAPPES